MCYATLPNHLPVKHLERTGEAEIRNPHSTPWTVKAGPLRWNTTHRMKNDAMVVDVGWSWLIQLGWTLLRQHLLIKNGSIGEMYVHIHHTSWYNQCIPVSKATKSNAGLALIIWTLALPCWTLLGAFWIENTSPASDVPKYVRWMRPEHPTLSNVQQVPSVNMASHNAPMTPNDLMIFLCSATWKSTDN